jgi:hypothetical protein
VSNPNRPLSAEEAALAHFMLTQGRTEGPKFLEQLQLAEVMPWRCPCGCGSINFQIKGNAPAPPGVHVLGDFVFGSEDDLAGIFIFESGGLLAGIEVYGLTGAAPAVLPRPDELRRFESAGMGKA